MKILEFQNQYIVSKTVDFNLEYRSAIFNLELIKRLVDLNWFANYNIEIASLIIDENDIRTKINDHEDISWLPQRTESKFYVLELEENKFIYSKGY